MLTNRDNFVFLLLKVAMHEDKHIAHRISIPLSLSAIQTAVYLSSYCLNEWCVITLQVSGLLPHLAPVWCGPVLFSDSLTQTDFKCLSFVVMHWKWPPPPGLLLPYLYLVKNAFNNDTMYNLPSWPVVCIFSVQYCKCYLLALMIHWDLHVQICVCL